MYVLGAFNVVAAAMIFGVPCSSLLAEAASNMPACARRLLQVPSLCCGALSTCSAALRTALVRYRPPCALTEQDAKRASVINPSVWLHHILHCDAVVERVGGCRLVQVVH